MTQEQIARTAHEVNRVFCQFIGDDSQKPWDESPEWQKKSAINGVKFHFDHPEAPPSASHDSWMKHKQLDGWVYGEEKNEEKKTHHCIVPFEELPKEQQFKDILFSTIVKTAYMHLSMFSLYTGLSPFETEDGHKREVVRDKTLRKEIDHILQLLKDIPVSRERALSITKLQEAIMWLGMDLKRLGEENPYPNSKTPENTIIDKTADNLKL